MSSPASLKRQISPPPFRKPAQSDQLRKSKTDQASSPQLAEDHRPSLAAIEAGEAEIEDHLDHFASVLRSQKQPSRPALPELSIDGFRDLYERNQHANGHHFVVHQHDHPVAGVHYDLRLQFSQSSSISFSIPYGLPGNPNSSRPNRMAIETRVHNLWNHLIESASHQTGSLLIWDTGKYEVLPRQSKVRRAAETEDELSAVSDIESEYASKTLTDNEKLFIAFQSRHLKLRLHGTRLPKNYTISMRLSSANDRGSQPAKPKRKRRKKTPSSQRPRSGSDSEQEHSAELNGRNNTEPPQNEDLQAANASEAEYEGEYEQIRSTNAYPGATNTIRSIHQRHWFLTLDRPSSGFVKATSGPDKGRWIRKACDDGTLGGFETFFVKGRDEERSVVTGRLADDVMADAGVKGYAGRKMWRPITE
ncbi:hypothetical protein MBLNU457_4757t1 [Dothideomycetes sp. NU457]